jgi:predicted nucleotidyltransferase/predicted transcriptional regulator
MGTQANPDRVSRLLFGSTRREVLALLLGRPDERFYLREILRAAGGGSGAVQREIKQLVAAGLVEREARGSQVYYSANRQAPIFTELQAIMEKTAARRTRARVPSTRVRLRDEVARLRSPILDAAAANGARDVRLFGSVARGEEQAASDIDFLVSLEPGRTLLDLARLEARLQELLHRPADVVTPESLRESIRATALREAVPV